MRPHAPPQPARQAEAVAAGFEGNRNPRDRGARDPSLECGRVAGTSPGKDRSARHRVAEAQVPGVAAWRTGHCSMVRVPTIAEEDAKRPNRERECLVKKRTRL